MINDKADNLKQFLRSKSSINGQDERMLNRVSSVIKSRPDNFKVFKFGQYEQSTWIGHVPIAADALITET
jgi:hypothetical protein